MSYQDPNQQNQYGGYSASQPPYGQQPPPYGQQQPPYSQPYGQQQPPSGDPYSQQQPPPYGQQQPPYGQQSPYGQQPYGMGNPGDTSMGLQENVAVALSYIWIVGLIMFFVEKKSRLVRFHAMQSLLLFGSVTVVTIILGQIPFIGFLGSLLGLASFIGAIILIVNAWQGRYFKLPVVGDYAERFTN